MRVGIDLGTTYSTVAYFDNNIQKSVIIKNKYGNNITPSVVGLQKTVQQSMEMTQKNYRSLMKAKRRHFISVKWEIRHSNLN